MPEDSSSLKNNINDISLSSNDSSKSSIINEFPHDDDYYDNFYN